MLLATPMTRGDLRQVLTQHVPPTWERVGSAVTGRCACQDPTGDDLNEPSIIRYEHSIEYRKREKDLVILKAIGYQRLKYIRVGDFVGCRF